MRALEKLAAAIWWRPRAAAGTRAGGWLARLASLSLLPLSAVYRLLWARHVRRHAPGSARVPALPVPVVVVGNLVVGGAGKTPTVIALVQALQREGWHPGVVSRGHGGAGRLPRKVNRQDDPSTSGDEPLLMARRTGVPVWTGRDRPATVQALAAAHPTVDVVVADDGLQHLALDRVAQVVVFDGRGAGNARLLPAGPLRQPLWQTLPPRTAVVYNAATATTHLPGWPAQRQIGRILPLADWWAQRTDSALPPAALRDERLIAAAGIGEPARFFGMLSELGLKFQAIPLADHAVLTPRPWPNDGRRVIVTEKDAVKLPPSSPDAGSILVATLDFALPQPVLDLVRQALNNTATPT
jgi:tetraacyldisaccharide 4'-kinase